MAKNFKNDKKSQTNFKQKEKFDPVVYTATVQDFNVAIDEICTVSPYACYMFSEYPNSITPSQAIELLLKEVATNSTPDLLSKKNIHTSLSVASNRATYKTELGYSFGWYINYTVDHGHATIDSVDIKFTILNDRADAKDIINYLEDENKDEGSVIWKKSNLSDKYKKRNDDEDVK